MRNYKDSDYALNKYSQGIVYKFVDGIVEVTQKRYLHDNPDKTEADVWKLNALSDEIYYRQEQRTSYLDVSMSEMEEITSATVLAIDTEMIRRGEEEKALGQQKSYYIAGNCPQYSGDISCLIF